MAQIEAESQIYSMHTLLTDQCAPVGALCWSKCSPKEPNMPPVLKSLQNSHRGDSVDFPDENFVREVQDSRESPCHASSTKITITGQSYQSITLNGRPVSVHDRSIAVDK